MTGDNGAHRRRRFIQHMRMKHALGLPPSYRMPTRKMRGRDRRRGTWWDRKLNCIAIEGQDFAQDTQEGGADRFELIPDSDEEVGAKGSSSLGDDDEFVPETEPQDVIAKPCANQHPKRFSTMLRDLDKIISGMKPEQIGKVHIESNKLQMENVKFEKESCKVQMGNDKLEMSDKVQMDRVKFEKDSAKVQMDRVKSEKESGKVESNNFDMLCGTIQMGSVKLEQESTNVEMETDKLDMSCAKDSQLEDDDFNEQEIDMLTASIPAYKDVFKTSKR